MKKIFKIISGLLFLIVLAVAALLFTFDPNNYKDHIVELVEQQTGRDFEIDGDISYSLFPWMGLKLERVSLGNAQGFSERAFAEIRQLDVKVMLLPLFRKEVQLDNVRLHGLAASLEVDDQGNNNWSDLSQATPGDTDKADDVVQRADGGTTALAGLVVNGVEFVEASIQWSDAQTDTRASVSDLSLETSAINFNEPVDVKFNAHAISNRPEVDARITLKAKIKFNREFNVYDIDGLVLNVQTLMQSVSKETITLDLKANAHVDLKQQVASVKSLEVELLDAVLRGDLDVSRLDSQPKIKGSIETSTINGRALAEALQIELPPMAGETSLKAISMQSNVEFSQGGVSLDSLRIGLDQTQITGWVHVLDMTQPDIDYSLKMSAIDLDDYMAPVPETTEVQAATTGKAADKQAADVEIELPLELLRNLKLKGLFDIEKAVTKDIALTDISIKTLAQDGKISIAPVTFNVLEGRVVSGVDLNVQKTPVYTIAVRAENLQAAPVVNPLLKGVMGDEEIKIDGVAEFGLDIKTQGNSLLALKKSATGEMNFDMRQTSITGVDIEYFVRDVIVGYLNEKKIDVSSKWRGTYQPRQTTAFRKVHASAVIAQGKINNDDFIMDSKRLKVTGDGKVDIINNTINYNSLVDFNPDRKKTFAEKLLDQPMGVYIHGPFEKLVIEPDTKQLARSATNLLKEKASSEAKKKIDDKKKEVKKKAKEELEDKLKNKLKGLFQ